MTTWFGALTTIRGREKKGHSGRQKPAYARQCYWNCLKYRDGRMGDPSGGGDAD
jgi:hypothetical protein